LRVRSRLEGAVAVARKLLPEGDRRQADLEADATRQDASVGELNGQEGAVLLPRLG
jgi:hypothetical protein